MMITDGVLMQCYSSPPKMSIMSTSRVSVSGRIGQGYFREEATISWVVFCMTIPPVGLTNGL